MRGDIKSRYLELALPGGKILCARTNIVFFAISQVCTRGVTLILIFLWSLLVYNRIELAMIDNTRLELTIIICIWIFHLK